MSQNSFVANYEATVITGLEGIAKDEARQRLGLNPMSRQGRILFSTDRPVENILKLKSICNLFVVLHDEKLEPSEIPSDSTKLEPLLMQIAEKCTWDVGLQKWLESSKFNNCEIDEILTKNEELRVKQPKFRVSCNRSGQDHNFTSPEICSVFGHVVDTKFGWPIKMKGFDLEIIVNFNENHLYVTISLSSVSLDRRNIVSTGLTTLRGATCYAMLRLAQIEVGDIVLDPMAGSGGIPVECCASWNDEWKPYTLAGELKLIPIEKCRDNLNIFKNNRPPNDLLQLDATSMPFHDNSVDVFVSDLPFGLRHGSKRINRSLYPDLLFEMGRVARLKTGRAVLLSQDFKSMNMAHSKSRHLWTRKECRFVKIGNLSCHIYVYQRTEKEFSNKASRLSKSEEQ